jgi:hypothetical protein
MLSRQDAKHAKKNRTYIPNLGALCAFARDIAFSDLFFNSEFQIPLASFLVPAAVSTHTSTTIICQFN